MAAIAVTTTAIEVLAAGEDRSAFVFQNVSDTDIYVGNTSAVTASEGAETGIKIIAGGQFVNSPCDIRQSRLHKAWYAIHAGTGNKTLLVNRL